MLIALAPMIHVCAAHRGLCVRTSQRVHTAQHERWLLWHSGSGLLAAVIGVTGLAFEARIVAGWCTHAICSGDGSTLARYLESAIADAIHGAIAGVTPIMARPEAKRSLHMSTGALAVDNESHVVASVAAARGLPMAAARVIMDPATRQIPAAALASMRANGTIDLAALIHAIMRRPDELPLLLRTAQDAMIAFAALLRCRRLLGPGLGLPSLQASEPEPRVEIPIYDLDERYLERS